MSLHNEPFENTVFLFLNECTFYFCDSLVFEIAGVRDLYFFSFVCLFFLFIIMCEAALCLSESRADEVLQKEH